MVKGFLGSGIQAVSQGLASCHGKSLSWDRVKGRGQAECTHAVDEPFRGCGRRDRMRMCVAGFPGL